MCSTSFAVLEIFARTRYLDSEGGFLYPIRILSLTKFLNCFIVMSLITACLSESESRLSLTSCFHGTGLVHGGKLSSKKKHGFVLMLVLRIGYLIVARSCDLDGICLPIDSIKECLYPRANKR